MCAGPRIVLSSRDSAARRSPRASATSIAHDGAGAGKLSGASELSGTRAAGRPAGPARPARRCRRPARGAARRSGAMPPSANPVTSTAVHSGLVNGSGVVTIVVENVEQRLLVTRRGAPEPADVLVGVVAGVVDPDRSAAPGRRPHQSLPQAGDRRRPIGDHPQHRVRVAGRIRCPAAGVRPVARGPARCRRPASPGRPGSRGRSWRRPAPGSGDHRVILRRTWMHAPRACRLHRVRAAARSHRGEGHASGAIGRAGGACSGGCHRRVRAGLSCGPDDDQPVRAPYGVITGDDRERGRGGSGRCW